MRDIQALNQWKPLKSKETFNFAVRHITTDSDLFDLMALIPRLPYVRSLELHWPGPSATLEVTFTHRHNVAVHIGKWVVVTKEGQLFSYDSQEDVTMNFDYVTFDD